MTRFQKSTLSLGALALAAGALTLLAPRAVHAVASALVQVTNTAANPAIPQDVNGQAAQQVEISCGEIPSAGTMACGSYSPDGVIAPGYVVPANQTLMVTGVDIIPAYSTTPSQCNGLSIVRLYTNTAIRRGWQITGASNVHYAYPSGFALEAGQAIGINVDTASACGAVLEMNGYLTSN